MKVIMMNETNQAVVVYGAALPWFPNGLGIVMKAAPVSIPYKEYGQFFLLGEHEDISMKPREVVEKEIDVSDWFQDFDELNKVSPIIVYWQYFPALRGYGDIKPSGGRLLIPKME